MKFTPELSEQTELAILADLDAGIADTIIAHRYGISVSRVQAVCGARGHTFECFDDGDGIWMRSYIACVTCGAPDEGPSDDD